MSFEERRRCSCQAGVIAEREIARLPSSTRTYAARVLQGGKELVSQKRVAVTAKGIPLPRVELIDAFMDAGPHLQLNRSIG